MKKEIDFSFEIPADKAKTTVWEFLGTLILNIRKSFALERHGFEDGHRDSLLVID